MNYIDEMSRAELFCIGVFRRERGCRDHVQGNEAFQTTDYK